jgi:hypothetical protein
MVHDDDTSRTWGIGAGDEPVSARMPRDGRTRELIADTARDHPNWGPIRICEELQSRGYDLDEPEVRYVLERYELPNWRL